MEGEKEWTGSEDEQWRRTTTTRRRKRKKRRIGEGGTIKCHDVDEGVHEGDHKCISRNLWNTHALQPLALLSLN